MRRFVADASHELRTPLTSVRGLAEFSLQQGDGRQPRGADPADDPHPAGSHPDGPAGGGPADARPVRPGPPAGPAARSTCPASPPRRCWRPALVQPDRPVTLHADAPVIVDGDAERLRQVLDNLIGNALQHTPRGSAVTVTVADQAGQAQLTVADNGPGMTADQASRVFERFYRTDRARSRARGGTGLGLSIAAALTAAHAGTITVEHPAGPRRRLPGPAAPGGCGQGRTERPADTGS